MNRLLLAAAMLITAPAWGQAIHDPVLDGLKQDGRALALATKCGHLDDDLAKSVMAGFDRAVRRMPENGQTLAYALFVTGQRQALSELDANKDDACATWRARDMTRLLQVSRGNLPNAD